MIDVKELRIGNWVQQDFSSKCGKDIKYIQVEEIVTDFRSHNYTPFDQLEPIPLTPEILKLCGVTNCSGSWQAQDTSPFASNTLYDVITTIETARDKIQVIRKGVNNKNPERYFENLQYVHQLQNAWYSATGKELEINLSERATV